MCLPLRYLNTLRQHWLTFKDFHLLSLAYLCAFYEKMLLESGSKFFLQELEKKRRVLSCCTAPHIPRLHALDFTDVLEVHFPCMHADNHIARVIWKATLEHTELPYLSILLYIDSLLAIYESGVQQGGRQVTEPTASLSIAISHCLDVVTSFSHKLQVSLSSASEWGVSLKTNLTANASVSFFMSI